LVLDWRNLFGLALDWLNGYNLFGLAEFNEAYREA